MSLLDRLRRRAAVTSPSQASPRESAAALLDASQVHARRVSDIVRVTEVSDAEFFIGDLFRRRFRHDPPDLPLHYVAFYRSTGSTYVPVGYVHYYASDDSYLCGGLVIDDRLYRRIPAVHRRVIHGAGGIAELLLRDTFARLAHAPALWGYVGDKQSEVVCLRAGFRRTEHQHVMVVWNNPLSDEEKVERLKKVIALGPF